MKPDNLPTTRSARLVFAGISFLIVLMPSCWSQSPPFQWAQQAGGSGIHTGSSVAVDPSGNIFVAGRLDGTATFGNSTLNGSGYADVLVAKYNPLGQVLWAIPRGRD